MVFVIINKVIFMQVNGKMIKFKVLELIYFKIVIFIKVKYKKDSNMVMVNIHIIMVIIIKDNGKMIKKMDMVYFIILIKINIIKDIGQMVIDKVMVFINGKMVINIKEVLLMELKVEVVLLQNMIIQE